MNTPSPPFNDDNSSFNRVQAPLAGGLNDDEMIVVQRMTNDGASKTTTVAPDIEWMVQCVDYSTLNGRPLIQEQGVPLKGFLYAIVDVTIKGATTCTLRPWFWNEALNSWISGTSEVVKMPTRLKTQVDSSEGFYVEIVEIQTTTPLLVKISIAIAGSAN